MSKNYLKCLIIISTLIKKFEGYLESICDKKVNRKKPVVNTIMLPPRILRPIKDNGAKREYF